MMVARSSGPGAVPAAAPALATEAPASGSLSSKATTHLSDGAPARTDSTFARCSALETKAPATPESASMGPT